MLSAKHLLLLCPLLLATALAFANATINFTGPVQGSVVTDSMLRFNADIHADYEVTQAWMVVAGRRANMLEGVPGRGDYSAFLSLAGLPDKDSLKATIYVQGYTEQDSASILFYYDHTLRPVIDSTSADGVANPLYPLRMRIIYGTPPYTVTVTFGYGFPAKQTSFTSATGWVDTTLDLSAYDGQVLSLQYAVTDANGYGLSPDIVAGNQVIVETNPYLFKQYEAAGIITDYKYNRVLFRQAVPRFANQSLYRLFDRTTHALYVNNDTSNYIEYQSPSILRQYTNPAITPYGAVFPAIPRSLLSKYSRWMEFISGNERLVNWRIDNNSNTLLDSGIQYQGTLAGKYVAWGSGDPFTDKFRNLDSNANEILDPSAIGYAQAVAADGTAIFGASFFDSVTHQYKPALYKYRNGVSSYLDAGSGAVVYSNNRPVLYYRTDSSNINFNILLARYPDGTVKTLSRYIQDYPTVYNYLLNDSFIVFKRTENNRHSAIWLQGPDGTARSIADTGTIVSLNSRGDVVLQVGQHFFFVNHTGTAMQPLVKTAALDPTLVFARDSIFYVALNNSLFRYQPVIPANKLQEIERTVQRDSVYVFKPEDFAAAFTGPGQLLSVKLASLPVHGRLSYTRSNGDTIAAGRDSVITRNQLSTLVYQPDTSYTGRDTFSWNASNGIDYAPANALVKLTVKPVWHPVKRPHFVAFIWPNPIQQNNVHVTIRSDENTVLQARILSIDGKILHAQTLSVVSSKNGIAYDIPFAKGGRGLYFLYLFNGREHTVAPFVKL